MRFACVTLVLTALCVSHVTAARVPRDEADGGGYTYSPFALTESWDAWHLLYGPGEILSAPLLLFMGPAVGVNAPLQRAPDDEAHENSMFWRMTSGIGVGLVTGVTMAPVAIVKGVYDTLTLGFFSDTIFE